MVHVLRLRVKLLVILALTVTNMILLAIVKPKQDPYDLVSFIKASVGWSARYPPDEDTHTPAWDKIVVTPARDVDDISWLAEDLPG